MTPQIDVAALREWIQVIALAVGAVGGVFALIKGVYEIQQSTKQRQAELRWKRANAARDLITDIHRDPRASAAVMMMDWSEGSHEYEIAPGRKQVLSYEQVRATLGKEEAKCQEPWERYVWDCFDWFFYYTDRIEHYIRTGLIEVTDVAAVFKPYARKVAEHRSLFDRFIEGHGYELGKAFLRRPEFHQGTSDQGSVRS